MAHQKNFHQLKTLTVRGGMFGFVKDRLLTNAKAFAKDVFIDQEPYLPFAPGTELVERSPAAPFSAYLNS